MTNTKQPLAMDGARFFGEMTATISHEIKNVMAIVNENAGLLEDMVAMNRQGAPFPAERIAKVSQSVSRQIARADDILQAMNRFAHSADHGSEVVDVGETLQFVAKLADRLILMQGAEFDMPIPAKAVITTTNRFFLTNVIWRCMAAAMARLQPGAPIRITAEATPAGPCLVFADMDKGEKFPTSAVSSLETEAIFGWFGARLTIFPEMGAFRVLLPEKNREEQHF
jgi:light-regulated signal transduction histidine kinase (bacteriophytochrome)